MKRGVITLILIVLLSCSFISADIIFTQPLNSVYNLGETASIPVIIKTITDISDVFQMDLICNGTATNFYRNGITLNAGDEKKIDASLILIKNLIGNSRGICKIRAVFGTDYTLGNNFKISDLLNVSGKLDKTTVDAGASILVTGKATRENGKNSNGFVEADIITNDVNQKISQLGTVNEGAFSLNLSLPNNLKAGKYSLEIKAFEKDSDGVITNNGMIRYEISVNQIPTNLELIIENKEINPGGSLKVKAILHDQTGDSINTTVFITIKNYDNKIIEQKELQTDEILEYQVKTSEPPGEWKIFAVSSKLTTENNFIINTKEEVSIEIVNQTVRVTNTGNVPYSKILLVKIGGNPINIPVALNVGESKRYILSAPNGEYTVEVSGSGGNDTTKSVSLTGNAINVKEAYLGSMGIGVWIFLILIAGGMVFTIFRKVYKKPFVRKEMNFNFKKRDTRETPVLGASSISRPVNRAELSLSIRGEKQEASVICVRIKNLKDAKSRKGSSILETIQKITSLIEGNKGVTYENQDYLFFILAPIKTRTFKNEKIALEIAEKINDLLLEHNKMFNQKMEFGVSLSYGTIVAKIENGVFKFMSMGTLMNSAKKIAHVSKEEVLLSEGMNDLLRLSIRTDKHVRDGISVFSVKEIKRENEEAKKFISSFLNRLEKK